MSETSSAMALPAETPSVPSSFPRLVDSPAWPTVRNISGRIRIQLQMPSMSLREALQLEAGQMLISEHAETFDVPLCIGGTQICWCEFAAIGERMGVRITDLV